MKPILYPATETAFDTNGIGVLSDAIRCVPNQTLNGQYELTLKYPVTGIHFGDIQQRSIILAKPDPDTDPQPFRVYRITKPTISGIVTVYARHIAYDLMGVPAVPFSAASAADALVQMKNNAVTGCPFVFYTDKSTAANMTVSAPTPIWTLLGGSTGSILDIYGGEYEFDRWSVNLLNRRGADRGVSIRYGKNLSSLEQDENCANCYTGVCPFWMGAEGDLVQLPENILDAPGTYNYVRILKLDLSEEWEEAPTEDQLRAKARSYMTANDIGVPTVSWKIEFVQLEQTEEYKHLGRLEQVLMGDTVSVYFPDMDVEASARVVEMEYDSILERYISVTLGSVKANLATTIAAQNKEIAAKPSISITERIATALAKSITGAHGGCARFLDTNGDGMPDELYIADNVDPDQAQKVWRFNFEGLAASQNGYDGPFVMGATFEAGLMAWMVTCANLIAGTIRSSDGTSFFFDLDNNIIEADGLALKISGKTFDEYTKETQQNFSTVQLRANEIELEVSSTTTNLQGQIDTANSRIAQNANSITSEVTRAANAENALSSRITQNADSITAEATRATNAENALSSRITANAASITSTVSRVANNETAIANVKQTADGLVSEVSKKVGSDEIISKINQSAEKVSISASKIALEGLVTANSYFKILTDGSVEAKSGKIGGWTIGPTKISQSHTTTAGNTYDVYIANYDNDNADSRVFHTSVDGTDTFAIRRNGRVNCTNLIATGGTIGGWTINSGKISGGDSSTGVAVMQYPRDSITWVFAAGGTSHDSYSSCPFRVSKAGAVYASNITITGGSMKIGSTFNVSSSGVLTCSGANITGTVTTSNLTATGGEIGGWNISSDGLIGPSSGTYQARLYPNGKSLSDGYIYFLIIYKNGGTTPMGGITTSGWHTYG